MSVKRNFLYLGGAGAEPGLRFSEEELVPRFEARRAGALRQPASPHISKAIRNACDRRESFWGERLPTKSVSRLLGMLTKPSQPIQLGCFSPSSGPTETSVSSP